MSIASTYVPLVVNSLADGNGVLWGGRSFTRADYISITFTAIALILVGAFFFSAVSPPPNDDDDTDDRTFVAKMRAFFEITFDVLQSAVSGIKQYTPTEREYLASVLFISISMIGLFIEQTLHWIRIFSWILFKFNPASLTQLQSVIEVAAVSCMIIAFVFLWRVRGKRSGIRRPVFWVKQSSSLTPEATPTVGIATRSLDPLIKVKDLTPSRVRDDFGELFAVLSDWKPGLQWCEKDYERHLLYFMAARMPTISIRSQVRLDSGRPDIVIDDLILIELKSNFSKGATDRAKGQVGGYLESWRGRGPVLLLLCGAVDSQTPAAFDSWLREQRQLGKPLSIVIAGTTSH